MTADVASQDRKPCPMCGEMIATSAVRCRFCGHYLDPNLAPKPVSAGSGPLSVVIPVNVHWTAILAGYFGLFSLIPFVAPAALFVSIVALVILKKNPQYSGRGRAWFGLIVSSIMTILLVGVIVMIVLDRK